MKYRFVVNPLLCMISSATSLVFLVMCMTMFPINRLISAAVFFILSAVFFGVALSNGAVIIIDSEKVSKRIAGIYTWELPWDEIKEVGVCGTKLFNTADKNAELKKNGSIYIYFSTQELDEEKRFEMVLKWPSLQKYYLLYSETRLTAIQMIWNNKIKTYNVGYLPIGEKRKN